MAKLIGNRYGSALFEAGLELNKLDDFHKEINLILDILKREPDLETLLSHPKISKEEKKDILKNVFEKLVSQEMLNFLYIIVDKRREGHLFEIGQEFEDLFNKHKNITKVVAITSIPMKDEAQEKLKVTLGEKLRKNIVLENVVDPSILGGVLLKVEDKIIDGSIKSQLENIERTIKTGIL